MIGLKVVVLLTGCLIAGEALALLVGMFLLSQRPNSWITWQNIFLLGLDILCGVGLIGVMLLGKGNFRDVVLFSIAVVAFSSHIYRDWEYFAGMTINRFLINKPLVVLNNVKLIGIIGIVGILLMAGIR